MRPIIKGDGPQQNGVPIVFNEYGDARPYLILQIGDYCSYCENQITNPAVEHEQPKSVAPGVEQNWYNFLLACVNCNSIKGHDHLVLDNYYWPDIHNTFLLFDYFPLGVIKVKTTPHASVNLLRATRTLELTGIDRFGSTAESDSDRRWIKRSEAWGKAEESLDFYLKHGRMADYVRSIVNTATSTGFWSVWIKVFEDEDIVINALINAFTGTFPDIDTSDINRL